MSDGRDDDRRAGDHREASGEKGTEGSTGGEAQDAAQARPAEKAAEPLEGVYTLAVFYRCPSCDDEQIQLDKRLLAAAIANGAAFKTTCKACGAEAVYIPEPVKNRSMVQPVRALPAMDMLRKMVKSPAGVPGLLGPNGRPVR